MCVDQRFQKVFEAKIFADQNNFAYFKQPKEIFFYEFRNKMGSITDCSGILVYLSSYLFADSTIRQRIDTLKFINELPPMKYDIIIGKSNTYFSQSFTAYLASNVLSQSKVLIQNTLGYAPGTNFLPLLPFDQN